MPCARCQDRIEALEQALFDPKQVPTCLSLSPFEGKVLGALMTRDRIAREALITAMYDQEEPEWAHSAMGVVLYRVRKKLGPGIKITTHFGFGWSMAPSEKAKVRQMLELERSHAVTA